jgi:(4S)-4-hydroxy-5-phosphonooxypentane-2,3-dione isomerase
MFVMLVKLQVKPELVAEFTLAILNNAALSVERDPGCVRFDVLQQQDDPTRWLLYEVYDQEQAWVEHRKAPHFLAFMEVGNRAIVTREATKLTGINITS